MDAHKAVVVLSRVQVPMFIKSMICGFSYTFLLLKFKSGPDIFKLRSKNGTALTDTELMTCNVPQNQSSTEPL